MYVYLWRALPGRRPVKIILLVVLLAALVLVLMEVVFPWGAGRMPYTDVTVQGIGPHSG